jgi:uncharacterized BrkB/YihY/UPF0761 family membrane protein
MKIDVKSWRSERKRDMGCCCFCSFFISLFISLFFLFLLLFSVSREIALGIVVVVTIKFDDDGSGERMRLKKVRRFYVFFYKKKIWVES